MVEHHDHPALRLERLAALANARFNGRSLQIPCPAHGGTNPNLSLRLREDGIAAKCFSQGCSYRDIAQAIEDLYGVSIGRRQRNDRPAAVVVCTRDARRSPKTATVSDSRNLRPYALQLWSRSAPIPATSEHPSRQWLAARHLWRPELPLPAPVRWIGAEHLHRDYHGAGAVITMAAAPSAWMARWPALPDPALVQLVFVAQDGSPAQDRGLNKRTYASTPDAVVVLGNPLLDDAPAAVDVAEGLADALALSARSPAPAVATLGTSGMASPTLAMWLATAQTVRIWADRDTSKSGRAPPGQRHGRELMRLVNDVGGNAQAVHAPEPHKDAAAAAAALGFTDPDPGWTDYARTLRETFAWPRWECARQAVAIFAEGRS